MAEGGRVLAAVMEEVHREIRPGVTPQQLDTLARRAIRARRALPAQLGYRSYPASICVSPNEIVVHGIPDDRRLLEGDVVSIDFAVIYEGYYVDMARTYPVGKVADEAIRLIEDTREAFAQGFSAARAGNRVGDISHAIEEYLAAHGLYPVREFIGHGIGRSFHEEPDVPNVGEKGRGAPLRPGLTLAIEPMVTVREPRVEILEDGWTATTGEGNLAAHYENTVAITEGDPLCLTAGAEH